LLLLLQHGANRADVHSASTSSRLDAIRNVYGASVVRDLMEIEVSDENAGDAVFKMDGYISNANYVAKKITMILFINGSRNMREETLLINKSCWFYVDSYVM
jgi:DNA mismatch repair protein MLH1